MNSLRNLCGIPGGYSLGKFLEESQKKILDESQTKFLEESRRNLWRNPVEFSGETRRNSWSNHPRISGRITKEFRVESRTKFLEEFLEELQRNFWKNLGRIREEFLEESRWLLTGIPDKIPGGIPNRISKEFLEKSHMNS